MTGQVDKIFRLKTQAETVRRIVKLRPWNRQKESLSANRNLAHSVADYGFLITFNSSPELIRSELIWKGGKKYSDNKK